MDAPHINKFCFASESCIPIRSLDTTLQCLYAGHNASGTSTDDGSASAYRTNSAVQVYDFDSSWLCYTDVPNNGYAQQLQVIKIGLSLLSLNYLFLALIYMHMLTCTVYNNEYLPLHITLHAVRPAVPGTTCGVRVQGLAVGAAVSGARPGRD